MKTDNSSLSTDVYLSDGQLGVAEAVTVSMMVVLVFVTFQGNLWVMVSIVRNASLRHSSSTVFVVSLMLVGILASLVSVPLAIAIYVNSPDYTHVDPSLCKASDFSDNSLMTSSTVSLSFISIDRLYSIALPMHHAAHAKYKLYAFLAVIIWGLALALHALPLLADFGKFPSLCNYQLPDTEFHTAYSMVVILVSFCLPAFVIICMYSGVFIVARRAAHSVMPTPTDRSVRSSEQVSSTFNSKPHPALGSFRPAAADTSINAVDMFPDATSGTRNGIERGVASTDVDQALDVFQRGNTSVDLSYWRNYRSVQDADQSLNAIDTSVNTDDTEMADSGIAIVISTSANADHEGNVRDGGGEVLNLETAGKKDLSCPHNADKDCVQHPKARVSRGDDLINHHVSSIANPHLHLNHQHQHQHQHQQQGLDGPKPFDSSIFSISSSTGSPLQPKISTMDEVTPVGESSHLYELHSPPPSAPQRKLCHRPRNSLAVGSGRCHCHDLRRPDVSNVSGSPSSKYGRHRLLRSPRTPHIPSTRSRENHNGFFACGCRSPIRRANMRKGVSSFNLTDSDRTTSLFAASSTSSTNNATTDALATNEQREASVEWTGSWGQAGGRGRRRGSFDRSHNATPRGTAPGYAKALRTVLLIVLSFVVFWGVFMANSVNTLFAGRPWSRNMYAFSKWLSCISYAVNPCLYGYMNRQIREELKQTLRPIFGRLKACCCCCCWGVYRLCVTPSPAHVDGPCSACVPPPTLSTGESTHSHRGSSDGPNGESFFQFLQRTMDK